MTVTLQPITKTNWRQATKLNVDDTQKSYVAPNWYSIIETLYSQDENHTLKHVGIFNDDVMVGYCMYGFLEELGGYEIVRLMVAQGHQAKGYGRAALQLIIDEIKAQPDCTDSIYISFVPANEIGRKLYLDVGFEDTGRIVEDEILFRMKV